jgi:hypothetical protein
MGTHTPSHHGYGYILVPHSLGDRGAEGRFATVMGMRLVWDFSVSSLLYSPTVHENEIVYEISTLLLLPGGCCSCDFL